MADASEIGKESNAEKFDLARLPATSDVVLPSDVKRRSLLAALLGVFGLVLATSIFLFINNSGPDSFSEDWRRYTLFGAAFVTALAGSASFVFLVYELGDWNRRRLVTISDSYVEITCWPLIGFRKFNHVPLADYTGVAKWFGDYGKHGVRYDIGLAHDDNRLSVVLYSSEFATGWDEHWRNYADRLGLPPIDEGYRPKDAEVDGTPAIKVLPGTVFTLNADNLPAAILFDAVPWNRLRGIVTGLAMSGFLIWLLWADWPPPADFGLIVGLLSLLAIAVGSLAIAVRSHLIHKTVLIDQNHITGAQRRLFGIKRWDEPLSAFQGLRRSAAKEVVFNDRHSQKAMRYTVTLVHPDAHKSVLLYRAAYEDDLENRLRYYADRLGVPILDPDTR